MTDDELVARARDGDADAFGELVARHDRAVHRTVAAALGGTADADDVVQEAWIAAHAGLGRFRGEASFRTWLLALTWRKALDHRRSVGAWWRWLTTDVDGAGGPGGAPEATGSGAWHVAAASVEDRLLARERGDAARRLVRSLPRKLRDALLLAGTGELTFDQMSALTGVPAGTLKWRVAEARRVLREKLERLGHG